MHQFKDQISQKLVKLTKLSKSEIDSLLEVPPDPKLGDYAFPCFSLARTFKKAPNKIAQNLAEKFEVDETIRKVEVKGPYLNFFIGTKELAQNILMQIKKQKQKYGISKTKKRTILIEGWQPNTHKAFHIGHIRNAMVSESISRIFEFQGHKVIRSSYMGDIGAHVAKWIWYYTKHYKGKIPKNNVTKWAGEIYTKATQISAENEEYQKQINDIQKKLESQDKELTKIWKKTRELCIKDLWQIFEELDCKIDRPYWESEVEQPGIKIVKQQLEKGNAEYSEGAIIADLEKYNLKVLVLLKSNGTSLYSTKDLALAYLKSEEYEFDQSLYIVGSEQEFHFKQLFQYLKIIGYPDADKVSHVSYGLVSLKQGKMSSRKGNIVLYEDLRDKLLKLAKSQISNRNLDEKQKQKVSRIVTFAALKFSMLNQDPKKFIIFDPKQALSFEGETGPYLQYTHARICSILRKSPQKAITNVNFSLLQTKSEHNLIKQLGTFPDTVSQAASHYKPSSICRYLLDLAQMFNEFYHKHRVLSDNLELSKARLALIDSTRQVLENGLLLLGIQAPERM
ncbi:MAG: Arginine--tRNA ligase [Candidatus Woesearchaeota archaeon]|nr:Arginine--tRNA ligase [Candidatus Woesearchaeota archaeon]